RLRRERTTGADGLAAHACSCRPDAAAGESRRQLSGDIDDDRRGGDGDVVDRVRLPSVWVVAERIDRDDCRDTVGGRFVHRDRATTPYHLWVRGQAEGNAYDNDSFYVQFSGAVDASGSPINRIGTTTAAAVSIENGANAGLSGWGWQDNSYGGLAGPMYFAT